MVHVACSFTSIAFVTRLIVKGFLCQSTAPVHCQSTALHSRLSMPLQEAGLFFPVAWP
jgi:hypothetical protein